MSVVLNLTERLKIPQTQGPPWKMPILTFHLFFGQLIEEDSSKYLTGS